MTRYTLVTRSAALLAMTGALAGNTVAAQTAACLTSTDAQSVAVAALPDALASARRACLPHLPASSALARSGTRIAQVYQPAADRAWPSAGRAFMAAVELPLPPGTDPQLIRPLMTAAISSLVEQEVKPQDCRAVDDFYSALEPLPPENMGKLLIALMKLDESSKKPGESSKNPFKICKDVTQ
ncbi:hypothetical protein [Blastomonas aquatica]|uniref:Uncharacterized protein n=1 Tax=Blastomonas aquatica TaxID=1510276 RepID=A0ABQ1JHK0_9SPHN|nr:hypothetical protein [Blastomonas aquatica]GGB68716.1 hypothetical protein GCM10010833_24920 [Blastomonas aquatica]